MLKWLVNHLIKGWVEATAFVTTGGTPTQFVKGDGSLDESTYTSQSDIIDNLTSTSTDKPLSANMGRELDLIKANADEVFYKTGGEITGSVLISGTGGGGGTNIGDNVALGILPTANPSENNSGLENATDGSLSNYAMFGRNKPMTSTGTESGYIQIDLGASFYVIEHRMFFHDATYYNLQYSSDGTNWTYAVGAVGNFVLGSESQVITFSEPVLARYWRIYGNGAPLDSDDRNRIDEWEIYEGIGGGSGTPSSLTIEELAGDGERLAAYNEDGKLIESTATYLTTETDPTVPAHVKAITTENISDWNNKAELSDINNGTLTLSTSTGLTGSDTFSANQSANTTFTVGLSAATQASLGKADSALQSETDPIFTASPAFGISNTNITDWNTKGVQLTADQPTANIHLRDSSGAIISTLNVGFLNNEGTTIFFNSATDEIELKDDAGNVLSSFPASALMTGVGFGLNLTGSTLDLVDSANNVIDSVTLNIANIQGLQAELNLKALKSTNFTAGTGLNGGGTLAADRTFSVDFTEVATAAQGAKADSAFGWGNHSTFGYLTEETHVSTLTFNTTSGLLVLGRNNMTSLSVDLDGRYLTSYTEQNDLTQNVTWINVPDTYITESSVVQHEAALTITESQISDLQHVTNNNQLINGAGYITTSSLPTVSDATININNGVTSLGSFTLNQATDETIDISSALPTVNNGVLTLSTSGIASGASSFSANQNTNSTFTVNVPGTTITANLTGTTLNINSSTGGGDTVDLSSFADDTNYYADSLAFNTTNGTLTIGRNGGLPDLTTDLDGRYLTSETDPIFTSSPAFNITNTDITNWDTKAVQLTADQPNANIHLRDSDGNIISTLNVGFLNNEGTTITFNTTTEEIELRDDQGNLLSSFPASSLMVGVGFGLNLTGSTLDLTDSANNVIDSVTLTIANIQGLQAALNGKVDFFSSYISDADTPNNTQDYRNVYTGTSNSFGGYGSILSSMGSANYIQFGLSRGDGLYQRVNKGSWDKLATEDWVTTQNYLTSSDLTPYALKSTNFTAGTGLTGGGTLAADRTFNLSAATQNSLALADSALQSETDPVWNSEKGNYYTSAQSDGRYFGTNYNVGTDSGPGVAFDFSSNLNRSTAFFANINSTNNPSTSSGLVINTSHSDGRSFMMFGSTQINDQLFYSNFNSTRSPWYRVASREWITAQNFATTSQLPTVNNNTITINPTGIASGGGSFNLNQGTDETLNITLPSFGTTAGTVAEGNHTHSALSLNWSGTSSQFVKGDGSLDGTTYADDSEVLHKTGNETKDGDLTLNDDLKVIGSSEQSEIFSNENNTTRLMFPKGGGTYPSVGGNTAGAFRVKLPWLANAPTTSFDLRVNITSLNTIGNMVIWISGRTSSGSFTNGSVKILGSAVENDIAVRFGVGGNNEAYIYIGDLNTVWHFPFVFIDYFESSKNYAAIQGSFDIDFVTSFGTIDQTISNNLPYADWTKLKGKPNNLALLTDIPSLSGYALESWVSNNFDNYQSWNLKTNGVQRTTVQSGETLDLVAGNNTTLQYGAGGKVTINSSFNNTTYTAGTGLDLTGTEFSFDTTWGDGRYLQSFTETDPTVPAHVKAITPTNISDWNAKKDGFTVLPVSEGGTGKTSIGEGKVLVGNASGGFDEGSFHTHDNKAVLDSITGTKMDQWVQAFNWGNHASAGYLTENDLPDFSGLMLVSETELLSSDILSSNVTPVQLLPAPGANKFIDVVRIVVKYYHGTEAYDGNNNYDVVYDDDTAIISPRWLIYTSDKAESFSIERGSTTQTDPIPINQGVKFQNDNAFTAGDGTMKIKIYYRIENF